MDPNYFDPNTMRPRRASIESSLTKNSIKNCLASSMTPTWWIRVWTWTKWIGRLPFWDTWCRLWLAVACVGVAPFCFALISWTSRAAWARAISIWPPPPTGFCAACPRSPVWPSGFSCNRQTHWCTYKEQHTHAPGQALLLHSLSSTRTPEQLVPPAHERCLLDLPPPHLLLHVVQDPQFDHVISAVKRH